MYADSELFGTAKIKRYAVRTPLVGRLLCYHCAKRSVMAFEKRIGDSGPFLGGVFAAFCGMVGGTESTAAAVEVH